MFITEQMNDEIYSQCRQTNAQANILTHIRYVYRWSEDVGLQLIVLHSAAHLWSNYKKASLQRLQLAYDDAMRRLLKRPTDLSAGLTSLEM